MQVFKKKKLMSCFIHGKNSLKLNETGEFLVKESEKLLHSYAGMLQQLHILDDYFKSDYILAAVPLDQNQYMKLSFSLTIQLQKLIWISNENETRITRRFAKTYI